MQTDLNALVERIEAATGADRDLDAAIQRAIGTDNDEHWFRDMNGKWVTDNLAPTFTASIDAAMTLVSEGCGFDVSTNYTEPMAIVWTDDEASNCPSAHAATPALALCAAALRARMEAERADCRDAVIARAHEPSSFLHPYWKAGHDIEGLFKDELGFRCRKCGSAQIDLSEDLSYGPMSQCKETNNADT